MSPREEAVIAFIEHRLESMLSRPEIWGSSLSVEEGVLQLLEVRRVLLQPSRTESVTHQIMRAFTRFVAENLDGATAEPLALQLEAQGRQHEHAPLLRRFIQQDQAHSLADLRAEHGTATETPEQARRVAAELFLEMLRHETAAEGRRRGDHAPSPILFTLPPTGPVQ